MAISMVSTVLEIEREAEAVLEKAQSGAGKLIADAKAAREDATRTHEEGVRREIADLEAKAAIERTAKVKELTATGDAALSAVRGISEAAFDSGVQHVMKALSGK